MDALVKLLLAIVFGYAAIYLLLGLIETGRAFLKGRRLEETALVLTVVTITITTGIIRIGGINPIYTFNGVDTTRKILVTIGLGVVAYVVFYLYLKMIAVLANKILNGK